jgi:alanine dehydrogenase
MPGAVPRTSTFALEAATLPYAVLLANKGLRAIEEHADLRLGVNTIGGKLTNQAVASSLGLEYTKF